tara:strand:- start:434 stop:1432 length:999 start_codon:yes stop_codon:yes gene_type:complete
MNNRIAHNKLKALANLLLERELYKEADSVSLLAEGVGPYGLTKEALFDGGLVTIPVSVWVIGALGGAGAMSWKISEDGMSILNYLTDDFGMENAEELYQEWYDYLKGEDIIDGLGSFPVDHAMGGTFMREFIGKKWSAQESMTESEFQDAFEDYYGESAAGVFQWGLDNEGGWVDSYNKILELNKAQKKSGLTNPSAGPPESGKDTSDDTSDDTPKVNYNASKATVSGGTEGSYSMLDDDKPEPKADKASKKKKVKSTPVKVNIGDTESVKKVQLALIAEGFSLPRFGADGDLGQETKNAIEAYKLRENKAGNFYGDIDGELTKEVVTMLLG